MMDAEIRERIKARLLSGRDVQTRGCLNRTEPDDLSEPGRRPVGMCCLGVVCEEAVAAGIVERVIDPDDRIGKIGYRPVGGGRTEWAVLPWAVAEWMGLDPAYIEMCRRANTGVNPQVIVNGLQTSLAQQNDWGQTFPQIAPLFDQL